MTDKLKQNLLKTLLGWLPQTADLHLLDDLNIFGEKGWLNFAIMWVSRRRKRRRGGELWRIIFLVWERFPWLLEKDKQNNVFISYSTYSKLCIGNFLIGSEICTWRTKNIIEEDLPAEMYLPWCTWHLQSRQGRRSEVDLLSESSPFDGVASPAVHHECALKTGLYELTSTYESNNTQYIRV